MKQRRVERYGHFPEAHRERGYVFSFFSGESNEPPHVHVSHGGGQAKIWIESFNVDYAQGMKDQEIREARRLVKANRAKLLAKWNAHFGKI